MCGAFFVAEICAEVQYFKALYEENYYEKKKNRKKFTERIC